MLFIGSFRAFSDPLLPFKSTLQNYTLLEGFDYGEKHEGNITRFVEGKITSGKRFFMIYDSSPGIVKTSFQHFIFIAFQRQTFSFTVSDPLGVFLK